MPTNADIIITKKEWDSYPDAKLILLRRVAWLLDVTTEHVHDLIQRKAISAIRQSSAPNGRLYITAGEVRHYLANQKLLGRKPRTKELT